MLKMLYQVRMIEEETFALTDNCSVSNETSVLKDTTISPFLFIKTKLSSKVLTHLSSILWTPRQMKILELKIYKDKIKLPNGVSL